MRKERQILKVSSLLLNDGRLGWLPANPRQWTAADLDRIANSIQSDPDFLEDRPVLVVPCDKKYIVFGGNMRREGSNKVGLKEIPAVIYYPETDADRDTIKRRAILDNGAFGAWDFDALANEWDDLPLTDWGVPAWDSAKDEQPFTPTIEDHEREGADYDSPKMVFQFTAAEFSFVSDALAQYDANKETALLMLLGYEAGAKE